MGQSHSDTLSEVQPDCPDMSDEQQLMKIVIISDTHNDHESMTIPDGDVLIHAGDWTNFGRIEHAHSFNEWLGTMPHRHKIVVNGNHENNAPWKASVRSIVSNAIFLKQESIIIENEHGKRLKIFGTDFFWPMLEESSPNPFLDQIENDVDILVTHGPAHGFVDGKRGCSSLTRKCAHLRRNGKLRVVISGHIHGAYGICEGTGECEGIKFINASCCGSGRVVVNSPIVIYC
mmetsp:Transcript_2597/g.3926  ORF Transcript_2597/g.3926 Transcript_2597/m.3926 type:complete len:232 (-) Transcript_2597:24-719(-)